MIKNIMFILMLATVIWGAYQAGQISVKRALEISPIWVEVSKSEWELIEETEEHYQFQDLRYNPNRNE